jgi:hypothetical protein
MRRHLPQVSYFYALEQNPSRDGFHVHALWADTASVFRKEVWAAWFKRYGRARIEPVRSFEDVSGYCSKYVTKEGAWWNVKLQWHRIRAMHDTQFVLDDSEWWLSGDRTHAGTQAPAASEKVVSVQVDTLPASTPLTLAEPCHSTTWSNVGGGIWRGIH